MSIPEGWQPTWDERTTRLQLDKHDGRWEFLKEEEAKEIEYHAEAYNLPMHTGDFSLLRAIGQAGAGFVEGFTTLNIADHPNNEYEQIFRNLGHLSGFAPGIMAGPAKLLPWAAARTFAATAAKVKSIPMYGADIAQKYAKQAIRSAGKGAVGRSAAVETTKNFILGNKAKHIVEGAFHLGTASAISSWQGGVDQMVEAGMGGALAGGVFRTIGNLSPGTTTHEKVGKALAGSLFMGLPATMRGATTPEQVYEYTMGAYFGGNETSWSRARANKFMPVLDKWSKHKSTRETAIRSGIDPEFHPKFDKLPEEVKPLVKEQAAKIFGTPEANQQKWMPELLMQELGLGGELSEQQMLELGGAKPTGEYKDGNVTLRFDEKIIAEKFRSYITSGNSSGDNYFAIQADKMGIPAIQYSFGQKGRKKGGTGYQRILSVEELQDAEMQLQQAEAKLKRGAVKGKSAKQEESVRNAQRTNWYKVKWADSVYVIGEFDKGKRSLRGTPGIAAQMAIQNGKDVYAFGELEGRWFQWSAGARGFIEAGKPPKPTNKFAGITDPVKKLSEKGKQAIRGLFEAHYTPVQSATEKVVNTQISKDKQHKIDELAAEIDVTQERYLEQKDIVLVKKQAGEDTTVEEFKLTQIAEESADLVQRHNRLANYGLAIRTIPDAVENKQATSGEISDKADTDFEGAIDLEVGKIPLQFTLKHLKKLYSGGGTVLLEQNQKRELAQIVDQTLRETEDGTPLNEGGIPLYIRKGSKENLSEDWANSVEEKLKDYDSEFTLEPEARRDMRKWMTRTNMGNPVAHLQSNGKMVRPMSNPKAPVTMAGNRKHQEEPLKRIEEAHIEAGGKNSIEEPVLYTLDHVTIEGENGRRDITPSEHRIQHPEEHQSMMIGAIKDLGDRGYYPLGGKGDNDRIIWAKFHPEVAANNDKWVASKMKEINFGKELKTSLKEFKDKYARNEKEFNRMVLSNLLYDIQMNGMSLTPANIKIMLTHPGFIKNSAAFNKRQQVWMNNAWSGDVKFIAKQLEGIDLDPDYYGTTENDWRTESGKKIILDNDYYYRGQTNWKVDKNGNLVIKSNSDDMFERAFPGQGQGTSVTGDMGQATEYALSGWNRNAKELEVALMEGRISERDYEEWAESLDDSTPVTLKINKKAFNTAILGKKTLVGQEARKAGLEPEKRVVTKEDIIIPKGQWDPYTFKPGGKDFTDYRGGNPDAIGKAEINTGYNYNYIIARDLSESITNLPAKEQKRLQKLLSTKNSDTAENVDGAIIVSDKVLDAINADFGNPESGQNKSFIVSPNAEMGALLGKYMMHSAGPAMSKLMDAKGLHMIMQESAVKQRGLREIGDYSIKNGELQFDKKHVYSDLKPEDVRGNFSVYGSEHFTENQRLPKQLLQSLLPTSWKSVDNDTISDVFEKVIGARWRGGDKENAHLQDYIDRAKTGELRPKEQRAIEKEIVENLDNIGVRQLVKAMQSEHVPGLSEAIYNKVLKIAKNEAMGELTEKNANEMDYEEYNNTINEFDSITDRVLQNANDWVKARRDEGIDANITSVYMHKFVRDFRVKAVQNWIINSATKPKRDNSGVGFMRPYDKAMRLNLDGANENLKRLEKEDDIFFLDNDMANIFIKLDMPGSKLSGMKLGALWEKYQSDKTPKNQKDYIEDVLEAVTVRVPMDSMSGAQVLKFAGFTGRKGHGILMHGRAMKAEGGADLDGDKSFIFFGGKGGMEAKWKKAYKSNKEEFYTGKDAERMTSDSKEAINPETKKPYRDDLVTNLSEEQRNLYNSKAYQYSPVERLRISEAAVDGRNQLGPAVVTKQVMSAAYSSIIANGGQDFLHVRLPTGKKDAKGKPQYGIYEIQMTARTSDKATETQRGLGRAQLGLASDPLDELGLTGNAEWFKHMWKAHFKVTGAKRMGKGGKFNVPVDAKMIAEKMTADNLSAHNLRKGIYGDLVKVNQAYWGRNWTEGRKFSMEEIIDKGNAIRGLTQYGRDVVESSVLARTGEILQGLDWSDSVFGKINQESLNAAYSNHNNILEEYGWLKGILGRTSFRVEPGNVVTNTMNPKFKIWTATGIDNVAANYRDFQKAIKGTKYHYKVQNNLKKYFGVTESGAKTAGETKNLIARRELLTEMRQQAEDFVINDMTDISTVMNVSRIMKRMVKERDKGLHQLDNVKEKQMNINDVVEMIHRKVESLKKNSYLMARDRRKMQSYQSMIDKLDINSDNSRKIVEMYKESLAADKKGEMIRGVREDVTAELDQMQIDNEIIQFKKKLTDNGVALFDQLMLGSLNRGKLNKITEFEDSITKWDGFAMEVVQGLRKEASRTSVSRLGFNSNAISDLAIRDHIGAFADNFKQTYRPLTNEQAGEIIDNVNKYKSRIEDLDPGLIETQMPSGYQGIKKGPVEAESKQIVTEISDMMSTWSNAHKRNLPYLVREVIGKDLNAMNKQDFVVFRNWLQEIQSGTWMQRMFQKEGVTELAKRHHMLFPKTINRELMRDDLVMMKEKGFFIDAFGKSQEGKMVRPTHYVDIVQSFIGKMNDASVKVSDTHIKKFNESMLFHSGLEDSQALWEMAIRKREASDKAQEQIRQSTKKSPELQDQAIQERKTRLGEAERKHSWKDRKGAPGMESKEYTVIDTDGKTRITMTGHQIQERINSEMTNLFKDMMGFINGKEGALDHYIVQQWDKGSGKFKPKYRYDVFMEDLQKHLSGYTPKGWKEQGVTDVPSHFGIDGLRKMARAMHIDMLERGKIPKEYLEQIKNQPESEFVTGDVGETYFPHMFFEASASKKLMNEAMKKILDTPDSQMDKAQKNDEVKKLYYKNKSLGSGEMRFQEMEDWDLVYDVLDDIATKKKLSENKINWFNANQRTGSMKTRELHMGGYSIEPNVVESYVRSISNTYHRQLSQMFGKHSIDSMWGQMVGKWGKSQTNAWQDFMRLYVQDAIGNPAIIPERLYEDPKMKIKGTPYGWWADNRVRDRINKIGKSLGLTNAALPESMQGIDTETLRHWSNLEAQYEMATLLAHPKSMVANIFGGTAHTIQSAGWGNFVKGRSPSFLVKINPEWKTKTDIDNFVVRQGVLPEYLVYEMGLQKEFQTTKGKSFLTDLTAKMTRDPEMNEKTIGEIASSYGLKDKAMNFAAKFMTVPERALRRDAFMAHYVHAWEKFGGAIKEYDHPFLIQMAKKGVKATQFLYNAPYRPAFARTALGKVMTRFQLWGWNSVRFRNDVHREAKRYGFREGTEEWRRFERTMQADLFTFALANVFAYSLFESNLPQPWGWMQDSADWIFGDEEERDKAFYGAWPKSIAPLQMVTPPGLRLAGPTFQALLSDDWSRMSQYYIYTMFPFGRMIRDVNPYAKGNLVENPMRLPEKLLGFPMMQLQRNITEWNDEEEPYEKIQ